MRDKIKIGTVELSLLDYAVSCNAILGIRDSGKTVTAKGIAEQLLDAGIPIFVFDAVGKWRWLKVPRIGRGGKGFRVVVAGGKQPDLPLTPQTVGEIVRASLRERIPLVIDLYDAKLSKGDWRRIVRESIRIIHYEANGVAHVFLEEAAEFVPQKVIDGETYAEVEKLGRMGGNASVGLTLINQRSQEVNKSVLELSHNLILGCQIGNKAIEAIGKWVDRLSQDIRERVEHSLPHLKSGQAWVWTRSNPQEPQLEQMPMCRSLHPDRRTPEVVLATAKGIDPDEFVKRLKLTIPKVIEQAQAEDPQELRKQIAKLRTELKAKTVPAVTVVRDEKPVLTKSNEAKIERLAKAIESFGLKCQAGIEAVRESSVTVKHLKPCVTSPNFQTRVKVVAPNVQNRGPVIRKRDLEPGIDGRLGKCERTLLAVLATYGSCELKRLLVLAGYAWSGSTQTAVSKIRSLGLIDGANTGVMQITEQGKAFVGDTELPEGRALFEHWLKFPKFGRCERVIMQTLEKNPDGMNLEALLSSAGYEWSGSTQTAMSRLRTAGAIVGRNTETIRLSDELLFAISHIPD